jgi:hypothetical protein
VWELPAGRQSFNIYAEPPLSDKNDTLQQEALQRPTAADLDNSKRRLLVGFSRGACRVHNYSNGTVIHDLASPRVTRHLASPRVCLSSAKLRSTDSVNPRAVLSRVRPRYRLYSKHRDRRCWTGPGIGIRVSFRTLEGTQLFRTEKDKRRGRRSGTSLRSTLPSS